jgi:transposase
MPHFVGLDVSQKTTSVCIVDDTGRRIWRGVGRSDPDVIAEVLRRHGGPDVQVGIETGPMTPWLVHSLRDCGLSVVCLDARHARAALKMQLNKTDANDAEGLAQIMRTGWYRAVHVKSLDAHRTRALLGARQQLVGMATRVSNHVRGVLKVFGVLPGQVRGLRFDRRVETCLADRPDLVSVVGPMLTAWRELRAQVAVFDRSIRVLARQNTHCRVFMTVPGIGPITGLSYVSTVEDPCRFRSARAVGAHLGLTPRKYQSGEVDRSGRISRCGDSLARTMLYEAAVVIQTRLRRPCALKDWADAIASRSGAGKARVALARKLSVILHAIWRSGEPFRWSVSLEPS